MVTKAVPENLSVLLESLDEASTAEPFVRYNKTSMDRCCNESSLEHSPVKHKICECVDIFTAV
jgi:hypothetical protein